MAYSKQILDHYENPRNVGKMDADDPRLARQLDLQMIAQQGNDALLLGLALALAAGSGFRAADAHALEEGGGAHQRKAARDILRQGAAAQHFQLRLHHCFDAVGAGARWHAGAGRAGGHILHLDRGGGAIIGGGQENIEQRHEQAERHGDEQDHPVAAQQQPIVPQTPRQPRAKAKAFRAIVQRGRGGGHDQSPSSAMKPATSAGAAMSAPPRIALARDRPTIT